MIDETNISINWPYGPGEVVLGPTGSTTPTGFYPSWEDKYNSSVNSIIDTINSFPSNLSGPVRKDLAGTFAYPWWVLTYVITLGRFGHV